MPFKVLQRLSRCPLTARSAQTSCQILHLSGAHLAVCNMHKTFNEPLVMAHEAEEGMHLCVHFGWSHSAIAFKFELLDCTPSLETICAR